MDVPPPDPAKLLQQWMEWEQGEATPGRVMANLKTGGLRILLEQIVAEQSGTAESDATIDQEAASAWQPTV